MALEHRGPRSAKGLLLWLAFLAAPAFSLSPDNTDISSGKADISPANLYILRCSGCHGTEGAGSLTGGIPDFRGYVAAFSYLPAGRRYVVQVPGVLASGLDHDQTAEVMNYVMTRWGGISLRDDFAPFTAEEVAALRRESISDVVGFRRILVREMAEHHLPASAYPWP
jgi:mono/diheme cytochrome c family protein